MLLSKLVLTYKTMYQNSSVNAQGPVYQNPAYNGSQSNDMGWNAPVHQPPNNHNQYPQTPPPYDSVYQSKSSPSDNLPRNNNAPGYNNTVNPSSYPYQYPQGTYPVYSQGYVTSHPATVQPVGCHSSCYRPQHEERGSIQRTCFEATGEKHLSS
ncbi:hypothetical protein Avbf_06228 [Armadillidium vulgare]|nr:hypothetical protein Avbf_06228 [Armadillidium vulgare]